MSGDDNRRARNPDCAAIGGPTISRGRATVNDEMRECIVCRHSCRWDMTEHAFFGFEGTCPLRPAERVVSTI